VRCATGQMTEIFCARSRLRAATITSRMMSSRSPVSTGRRPVLPAPSAELRAGAHGVAAAVTRLRCSHLSASPVKPPRPFCSVLLHLSGEGHPHGRLRTSSQR
jgi:hypothetical protein